MPVCDIVIVLVSSAQVLLILPSACLLDAIEVLHDELLFSFGDTGTVTIRSDHVEFVNIILLSQAQLSHCHRIII